MSDLSNALKALRIANKRIDELEKYNLDLANESNNKISRVERQQQRIAELEAKTSCCMGVGNGNGRLFVYGDHESIKTAQRYVLERDELAATVERLRDLALSCGTGRSDGFEAVIESTPQQNLNAVKRDCLLILARDLSSTGEIESNIIECIEMYANTKYPSDKDGE